MDTGVWYVCSKLKDMRVAKIMILIIIVNVVPNIKMNWIKTDAAKPEVLSCFTPCIPLPYQILLPHTLTYAVELPNTCKPNLMCSPLTKEVKVYLMLRIHPPPQYIEGEWDLVSGAQSSQSMYLKASKRAFSCWVIQRPRCYQFRLGTILFWR